MYCNKFRRLVGHFIADNVDLLPCTRNCYRLDVCYGVCLNGAIERALEQDISWSKSARDNAYCEGPYNS